MNTVLSLTKSRIIFRFKASDIIFQATILTSTMVLYLLVEVMSKTPHISFVILYRSFALPLMKFIIKRVGANQETAEEVFSQTITSAWEGYHTFKNKSKFFTWICRIALNKIADYYRTEIHEQSVFVAPLLEEIAYVKDDDLAPEEKLALQEMRISVRACLSLLPPEKRQLLYLRFWKSMSIKEIAKFFGVSERSVEGKIYRAKRSLAELLVNSYPDYVKAPQTTSNKTAT